MKGSIDGAGQEVGPESIPSYGYTRCLVRISGTFTATLEIETKLTDDAATEYVSEQSPTAPGVFLLDVVNPTDVKVRASSYSSGTANVAILPA